MKAEESKTVIYPVRMTEAKKNALKEIAGKKERSIAYVISVALDAYIKRNTKK